MKRALKTASIFGLMAAFATHSIALGMFSRSAEGLRRRRIRLISAYARVGLKALGIRVHTEGRGYFDSSALFVGNHLSYLDILILASQRPTCFVTSEEIRRTAVLGQLCELGACLFVERRSRARLNAEVGQITQALNSDLDVTIFPESTSSNGDEVLRFRRPLFQAALESGRPVIPFCLNYESIDGQAVTLSNRDKVCWYGDMGFLSHLWSLAGCDQVRVRVNWLEPLGRETHPELTPDALAQMSHALVKAAFHPFCQKSNSAQEKIEEAPLVREPDQWSLQVGG